MPSLAFGDEVYKRMSKFLNESSWNFPKIKWLDKYMLGHSGFIAGGCFKQIFTEGKVKDIDIFFGTVEEHAKAVIYFRGNEEYSHLYSNKKVEAFKDKKNGMTIELVNATCGSAGKVIGEFDFTITKFAYYKHTEENEEGEEMTAYKCLYHPLYFEHLTMKRLVIDDKTLFPISTFERMFKYAKYGYFPCRETKKRIVEEMNKLKELPDVSLSLYDGLD